METTKQHNYREDTFEEASSARRYARDIINECEQIIERAKYATEKHENRKWNSRLEEYFGTINRLAKEGTEELKNKNK